MIHCLTAVAINSRPSPIVPGPMAQGWKSAGSPACSTSSTYPRRDACGSALPADRARPKSSTSPPPGSSFAMSQDTTSRGGISWRHRAGHDGRRSGSRRRCRTRHGSNARGEPGRTTRSAGFRGATGATATRTPARAALSPAVSRALSASSEKWSPGSFPESLKSRRQMRSPASCSPPPVARSRAELRRHPSRRHWLASAMTSAASASSSARPLGALRWVDRCWLTRRQAHPGTSAGRERPSRVLQ